VPRLGIAPRQIATRLGDILPFVEHVTAITHRKDAVYPATIVGMPPMEDFYIDGASRSEIASGSELGIDATKKLPGEGFKRPWPLLIKMDAAVTARVEKLFGG